jgi:hypothetical protein
VAQELTTRRQLRFWQDELTRLATPPYAIDRDSLVVAFYASAEIGCHLALGWPVPSHVLDLFTEFRALTNGRPTPCGNGLLGVLAWYGLDALEGGEKEAMPELALRGGPWTADERSALLDYCASDVAALARLLPRMLPTLDIPRALIRGRFMVAAARMEWVGVPVDAETLRRIRTHWHSIQDRVIERVDASYGVFEGRTFKRARWEAWLATRGIPWPRLPSGALALDDDSFREMARAHPSVAPIHELRATLSELRLEDLAVGSDARNRTLLSAFRAKTSRNAPSNTKSIFGPAVWLRGLIRPEPGMGLAYIDWSQQEFGIAASLSGDENMLAAYRSGDPYLTFAQQAGAAPPTATKVSHGAIREQFKACALAVQYGMGEAAFAHRIGQSVPTARRLLDLHHLTFKKFWRWSDAVVDRALLRDSLHTVFGWPIRVGAQANVRAPRNFPMQANGAEMLRLACCFATEAGVAVCMPIHDAMMIEAPLEDLEAQIAATRQAMAEASILVLDGFILRTDAAQVCFPDRYQDPRGARMWKTVGDLLAELELPPSTSAVC